jgi:RNA recognition motif-containing protein
MKKKLYVGNLAENITDSELEVLFAQAGIVKSAIVFKNQRSGLSVGFGFVDM